MTEQAQRECAVAQAVQHFGQIEVRLNIAGITKAQRVLEPGNRS